MPDNNLANPLLDIDLGDIDIDDLLGSTVLQEYRTDNIVTDGHKPQIRTQSKEKFAQESEIEEKMSRLVM